MSYVYARSDPGTPESVFTRAANPTGPASTETRTASPSQSAPCITWTTCPWMSPLFGRFPAPTSATTQTILGIGTSGPLRPLAVSAQDRNRLDLDQRLAARK